jgi:hypothetical protein
MPRKPSETSEPRWLGEFRIVPRLKRNNPQSLRKTLYEITERMLGKNLSAVSDQLKEALRSRHGRSLHATLSGEVLYNLIRDDTQIKYYHLEAYARRLEVPVSLLLLYSRLTANQDDRTPELNEAMLRTFGWIVKDAAAKLAKDPANQNLFQVDDLIRWISVYREETNRVAQASLFPLTEE